MTWAFEAYASGEWTLISLQDELVDRGVTTVPGPKRPAKPISVSQLHRFLRSSYYIGKITYGGVEYDGQHPPLVPVETWERVQEILASRNVKGEKHRVHNHYLKSSLFCASCGSRMIVSKNTNRHGTTYPYFVCVGGTRNGQAASYGPCGLRRWKNMWKTSTRGTDSRRSRPRICGST